MHLLSFRNTIEFNLKLGRQKTLNLIVNSFSEFIDNQLHLNLKSIFLRQILIDKIILCACYNILLIYNRLTNSPHI